MDGCALASLIPSADQVEGFLAVLGTVVTAASALAAATPTPPPGTRAARLYRYLEIAALLVGRAKETGTLPATPSDRAVAEALALVRRPG